jgi:alpha-L-fucosidase
MKTLLLSLLIAALATAEAAAAAANAGNTETAPPPEATGPGRRSGPPDPALLATLTGGKTMPEGPFTTTWESVEQHYEVPQWFRGMMEWHRNTYGPHHEFGYKDFIPLFTASKFDAKEWAELFRRSGAKYVIPTAEHHDGFALWDSALTPWDAKDMGPRRDLIGELAEAVRAAGLKFGVSNHRIEHFNFINPADELRADLQARKADLFDPAWAGFYNVADRSEQARLAFYDDWLARNFELIDKYQPDMLWFDNGVNARAYDPLKLKVAAYYYNRAKQWGKQVSVSTKRDAYLHGSILDFERGHPSEIRPGTWQTDNTVHHRWGFLNDTLYRSVGILVRELVDNVSKNGNLLLNFAPKADGTFPEEQVALLLGMGRWLDLNGEAIYGTRTWIKHGEGPTKLANPGNLDEAARIHREAVGDLWLPSYTGRDFRFTRKGSTLYAIALAWPHRKTTIASLARGAAPAGRIAGVELLGHGSIPFVQDDEGLQLTLPTEAPCEHAFVFKITGLNLD